MPNLLTFLGLAERVIAEEKRPLSPSEIWKVAVIKHYDSMLRAKQGKTPASTLYSAIFTDARQNPDTLFVNVGESPGTLLSQNARAGTTACGTRTGRVG